MSEKETPTLREQAERLQLKLIERRRAYGGARLGLRKPKIKIPKQEKKLGDSRQTRE